jgi:hypothetical protein
MAPMFGWSHYSLEGALTSCSVEWFEKSFNVISYNISMFIFVYFIPLLIIFGTSLGLIILVKKGAKGEMNRKSEKKLKNEKNLTISLMIMIGKICLILLNF